MSTPEDLMGYGLPPFLAGELGNRPQSINGAGTTQATATAILSEGHLVLVTGASSATGCILPSGAKIGTPYYVCSVGGTAAKIYAPVGGTLNGTASSTGITFSAAASAGIFMRTNSSSTAEAWISIPVAP